jgi:hypothetical protein
MTRKPLAIAVAMIATLAVVTPASAQSLSLNTATKLAKKLGSTQVDSKRAVVRFHIYKGKRVSSRQINFPYDDRSRSNVYCQATIAVKLTGNTAKAQFVLPRAACQQIPEEVLAYESVTRSSARAVIARSAAIRASATAFTRSLKACRSLKVPHSRSDEAELLLNVGSLEALEGPIDAQLGNFVAGLAAAGANQSTLKAGAAAWADYLAVLRSLPSLPDPCKTLAQWEKDKYAADKAPVDFAALTALDKRGSADLVRIARAAKYMARTGAFPSTVVNFTPDGLIFREKIDVGVTGG